MTDFVFVYGSLKRGSYNHCVLGGSEFIGCGATTEEFILTDCGFPYMIVPESLSEDAQGAIPARVVGEVYKVTDGSVRAALDSLEGVGYCHYKHRTTDVELNEQVFTCLSYVPCDPDGAYNHPLCFFNKEGFYEWT